MADHDVNFIVPERELKRAPVEFRVRRKKQIFGTLFVSEGGLKWVPARKQIPHEKSWREFAEFITGERE